MNQKKLIQYLMFFILLTISFAQKNEISNNFEYTIGYSTYLTQIAKYGAAFNIFTDDEGFIYIAGNTGDRNFPVSENAYQKEISGSEDAFVSKFSPDGQIVFSTLLGGSKREHHTGLTVDKDGYIYVVGGTHSSDFPVTPQAYDTSFNGEKSWGGDVYLVKLNPTGSKLEFSTFIGGSAQETATGIAVDGKGNIIIGGCTLSSDFPTTEGVIDNKFRGFEAFLAKFNPTGKKLIFSTLLGGNDNESVESIVTDSENNIYLSGFTRSTDLPVTENAVRKKSENFENSEWWVDGTDQYLMKINEKGTKLLYSSYIGGKSTFGCFLTLTNSNRLMICGNANTKSFPLTDDAFCKTNKGDRDGFISIFDAENMKLEYSTLFGGSEFDLIKNAYFFDENCIVIGGETNSSDFPLTKNAIDKEYFHSDKSYSSTFLAKRKFFISIIDIKNNELKYSSYFGGGMRFHISPDKLGNLGFVGVTKVTDFPSTDETGQSPPKAFMLGRLLLKNFHK